jgi:zona occludens toxin
MAGAAITLKTGIPGSGKTLSAVEEIAAMQRAWEKDPSKYRPIYVHGIRGLTLDHQVLPVYPVRGQPGDDYSKDVLGQPAEPVYVDWSNVADGAVVLIDEAQKIFRPRAAVSAVPVHVAWFETARQNDVLVILMTQAPTSIDHEIRKRVGKHQHYKALPLSRSIVYEWFNECSTTLNYRSAVSKTIWKYPRNAYAWYQSAQGHSGGAGFKFPMWAYIPLVFVAAGVFAVPYAWNKWRHSSMVAPHVVQSAASEPALVIATTLPPAASAPADAASTPIAAASAPTLGGCMHMGDRCLCIDSVGHVAPEITGDACRKAASEYGAAIPYPSSPAPDSGRVLAASFGASAPKVAQEQPPQPIHIGHRSAL